MNEYIKLLESNKNINFVIFDNEEFKYVAIEDTYESGIILVHKFKKIDGTLEGAYLADDCNSLEEFLESE